MQASPNAQEVADALAMTIEREDAMGAPWCPPADGAALRRWVTDRSASLGTGLRRMTRLARLMAVADGRDYIRFLYERVTSLRARQFRLMCERAAAEGRLPRSIATLTANGVHLHEPALAPQGAAGQPFEIDFAQMPRLAALLDFLHNSLGFAEVADMLAGLVRRGAASSTADETARALQAALNAWLSTRLESANHMLQAQRNRAFVAGRGRVVPETIDDEAILLFWTDAAAADDAEGFDGFRLFRSAAAAMLRYRAALRDATSARYLERALAGGTDAANDNIGEGERVIAAETWRSPLRELAVPPASRVKWLNAKEQHALANYLGAAVDGDDAEAGDGEEDEAAASAWRGGLAGEERFDLAFWRTLLRADVFGAAQASIVARLRKRAEAASALAQAMAALDPSAYATAAAAYAGLREQLHLESLAAFAVLMEEGAAEAVILMRHLGGAEAVSAVLGGAAVDRAALHADADEPAADALRAAIAPALRAAIADPDGVADGAGRRLLRDAVAARRKVSRAGFRREDRGDAEMVAALRAGAACVFELLRELDRLILVFNEKAATGDFAGDTARFQAAFRAIYLPAATA